MQEKHLPESLAQKKTPGPLLSCSFSLSLLLISAKISLKSNRIPCLRSLRCSYCSLLTLSFLKNKCNLAGGAIDSSIALQPTRKFNYVFSKIQAVYFRSDIHIIQLCGVGMDIEE